jgi:leucyl-tRNA synthetase
LAAIDGLERWPEKVRLMQTNWLGRSEGALIRFPLAGRDGSLEVFTTRPDTLWGASFMAIAPDHPLAQSSPPRSPELAAFIEECLKLGTSEEALERAEKRGFDTGLAAGIPWVRPRICRSTSPISC